MKVDKSKQKPAAKAAKPAVKSGSKAAAPKVVPKAAPKATAKAAPVGKAASKPAAKAPAKKSTPVAKKPVKVAVKPAAKPAAGKAAKPVPSKATKPAAPAPTKASQSVSKPAKPEPTKAAPAKPVATPSPVKAATKEKPVTTTPVPAAPAVAAPAAPAPATRVTRNSRLAQITVPSMAQAVASTAAKASYTQIMTTPVLVPPPHVAVKKDAKLANNWKTKPVDQLTDAEVLAMPDSEYMNDAQMAFFRLKLARLKQDILANAGETTEHLREDTVIVPDPADRATIEEEHALELRTRDRERKLLKKIEQSIVRIDAGDYGYCDETGEPIGVGRLLARPTATLSLEAQQRRELKQKMFGD